MCIRDSPLPACTMLSACTSKCGSFLPPMKPGFHCRAAPVVAQLAGALSTFAGSWIQRWAGE
eukprot:1879678-Prorocentrum_lima.AAC.1